jgi:Uma2 family endonuclease
LIGGEATIRPPVENAGSECYIQRMNIALRRALTVSDYLAWGEAQNERPRTELINGQIVAMPAERVLHNRIKGSVYLTLVEAVEAAGLPCEVFTDGLTVPIDDHTAYEPDALVRCGPPLPVNDLTVIDPVIIIEVISPTTAHTDTSAKLIGYFKLASVRHYLVIDPDGRTVTHHRREHPPAVLTAGALRLDPPGLELAVEDLLHPRLA